MLYLTFLSIILFGLMFPKTLLDFYAKCLPIISSKRFLFISRISLGFIAAIFLFSLNDPAHAQFYGSTEKWLQKSFASTTNNAGIATAITLIFNVLRALFVIYLGIALVRVIVAARNDDDWQQLARIPLILVLAVTLGDLLAGLITGPQT